MVTDPASNPNPQQRVPGESFHIPFIEANGKTFYLLPGARLLIGKSAGCDIRLAGPGIATHHARLSLHPDGRIWVKPIDGEAVRIGKRRSSRAMAIEDGTEIGIGLTLLRTGRVENNLAIHLRLGWRTFVSKLRRAKRRAAINLISIAIHAFFVLFLLQSSADGDRPDGLEKLAAIGLDAAQDDSFDEGGDSEEEEMADKSQENGELEEVQLSDPQPPQEPAQASSPQLPQHGVGATSADELLISSLFEDLGTRKKGREGKGRGGGLQGISRGRGSGRLLEGVSDQLRRTQADLRDRGFEVAFLFDSTSSMGSYLDQAKRDLQKLLFLFAELVPETRIGLLTFRDHGDAYVTRQTKLGIGHFQALAFLGSVQAEGGGDTPEAVDVAMARAIKWKWKRRSRKILVLVGDAPPRGEKGLRKALALARGFRRNKRGQVHSIYCSQDEDTVNSFRKIAKAGGGRAVPLGASNTLTSQLLSLCLGNPPKKDLDRMMSNVDRAFAAAMRGSKGRIPPKSALIKSLTRPEPDPVVVSAWLRAGPKMLLSVMTALKNKSLSPEGLQALYYLTNHLITKSSMGWGEQTIAPEHARPPRRGVPKELRERLRRLER